MRQIRIICCPSCPPRDVSRSSRSVGMDAMDAAGVRQVSCPTKTPAAYGEVVWSWRRDPGATLSEFSAGNGGKKGRFPGESTYKPSNHCAGKAGMSWLYLSNPCAFLSTHCTRCCGRSRRPAFPAPSVQERDNELASPGQIMSREYLRPFEVVWANSLSSRTSEHSERRS